jgi:hypothetical protein
MVSAFRRKLTFSNVVALLALFVALGGSAYAVSKNSVGTKQLKSSAVHSSDIANGAVTTKKIKNDAVTGAKVKESTLGEVPSAASARPTGPASGDLSGSYPNPTINAGAVGASELGQIVTHTNQGSILDVTANGSWTSSGNITASCDAGERLLAGAAHFDGGGTSSNFAIQDITPDFTANSVTGEGISDAGGGLANQVNFIVTAICLK